MAVGHLLRCGVQGTLQRHYRISIVAHQGVRMRQIDQKLATPLGQTGRQPVEANPPRALNSGLAITELDRDLDGMIATFVGPKMVCTSA